MGNVDRNCPIVCHIILRVKTVAANFIVVGVIVVDHFYTSHAIATTFYCTANHDVINDYWVIDDCSTAFELGTETTCKSFSIKFRDKSVCFYS